MRWTLKFLTFVLLSIPVFAVNNYYVSSSGSDSNAGTIGSPWATIAHANASLAVGSGGTCTAASGWLSIPNTGACVHVVAGTYGATSTTVNGSISSQITYISETQYGAKLVSGSGAIWNNTGANIVISGFDISGNGTATTCSGLFLNALNNQAIGNYVHDIPASSCSFGGAGIITPPSINGAQALRNILNNIGPTGPSAFIHGIYFAGINSIVENNVISNTAGYGIQFNHNVATEVISNNVVMNGRFGGIGSAGTSTVPFDHSSVFNNIVVNTGNGTDCAIEERFGTSGVNNVYRNNLLAHNSCGFHFENGVETTTGNLCDVAGLGCQTVISGSQATVTNIFVNYTGNAKTGDYHLKAGSVAIAAGVSGACASGGLTPCIPSIDFSGVSRPLSGAQDMGAYVFSSAGVPVVSLTPSPLAYGNVAVSASSTLTGTLANTGAANLTFSAATISGTNASDYSIVSTTCASPLTAGSSCTYSLKFTPAATGSRSAALTLNDNAAGSPHQLPLTGTGGVGVGVLSPNPASFGVVASGSCSAAQSIILTNTGNASFNQNANSSITPSQVDFQFSFAPSGSCNNSVVAPGASCTTNVKFCPPSAGAKTATFNAFTDANNPSSTLNGTGGAPIASVTPASGSCGSVQVGASSTCQAFTLTNTGNINLAVGTISLTGVAAGSYSQSNNCPVTLPASNACTITVFFQPTGSGTLNASLSVASNATGSPSLTPLSGVGVVPATLTLSPSTVNFGNVVVGATSSATVITLHNAGGSPATITSITVTPLFSQTNNCPASLAGGDSCTISVTTTPSSTGVTNGTISVSANQ